MDGEVASILCKRNPRTFYWSLPIYPIWILSGRTRESIAESSFMLAWLTWRFPGVWNRYNGSYLPSGSTPIVFCCLCLVDRHLPYNTTVGSHRHRPTDNPRLQPGDTKAKLYQALSLGDGFHWKLFRNWVDHGRWNKAVSYNSPIKHMEGCEWPPTEAFIGATASTELSWMESVCLCKPNQSVNQSISFYWAVWPHCFTGFVPPSSCT